MATRVVMQPQPMVLLPQAPTWSTGLFHCFQDMNICCLYFWCFWCMTCNTAQKFGECVCLPLLDLIASFTLAYFYIPMCVPPIGLSARVSVRQRYGIPGSISDDCPKATFCSACSWCQIAREIKLRSKPCSIVTHQPAAVQQQAPPPVQANLPMGAYYPPSYSASPPNPTVIVVK
ncbi:cornifelin-like [Conger conger]|uniref:cornifelin-like n=1 Tax=Conger conger TaxID=82655 RepID=UPI002A5A2CA3|nr:cornifelin-like [Conger conger]XP_061106174.1 cornifelin-like [Conger conger]XP_061106175.1 cornifelin-like [Conger conger]XP_061106232.1 cornifelin-like [Conger conger]